jgi:hypothetical protein
MYNRLMFDNALQSDANARDKPIRVECKREPE